MQILNSSIAVLIISGLFSSCSDQPKQNNTNNDVMDTQQKLYPFDNLKYASGYMSSSIHWSSLSPAMSPTHSYSLYIPYVNKENKEEGRIEFDMIAPFGDGSWSDQAGKKTWNLSDKYSDSSMYVEERHHPIDLLSLEYTHIRDNIFRVEISAVVDFTFEGASFDNTEFTIDTEVSFSKLKINTMMGKDATTPVEWGIPDTWTESYAVEFISQFVDAKHYGAPVVNKHDIEFPLKTK